MKITEKTLIKKDKQIEALKSTVLTLRGEISNLRAQARRAASTQSKLEAALKKEQRKGAK